MANHHSYNRNENMLEKLANFCLCNTTSRADAVLRLLRNESPLVELQEFAEGSNVVCTFGAYPTDKVILTAHHDRVAYSPGANDNGASVIVLAELARELYQEGFRSNDLTILFADGEEKCSQDYSGAYAYAKKALNCGNTPDLTIVLELCGSPGEGIGLKSSTPGDDRLVKQVEEVVSDAGIPSARIWTPYCDCVPLKAAGVESVLLTILPQSTLSAMEEYASVGAAVFPSAWGKIHSSADNVTAVSEDSMRIVKRILRMIVDRHCE